MKLEFHMAAGFFSRGTVVRGVFWYWSVTAIEVPGKQNKKTHNVYTLGTNSYWWFPADNHITGDGKQSLETLLMYVGKPIVCISGEKHKRVYDVRVGWPTVWSPETGRLKIVISRSNVAYLMLHVMESCSEILLVDLFLFLPAAKSAVEQSNPELGYARTTLR